LGVPLAEGQWLLPQDKKKGTHEVISEPAPSSDEIFDEVNQILHPNPDAAKIGPDDFRSKVAPRPAKKSAGVNPESFMFGSQRYSTLGKNAPIQDEQKRSLFRNTDVVLLVDRSASMLTPDCPGLKTRWEVCKDAAVTLATDATKYGNGSLTVVLFDAGHETFRNVTAEMAKHLFETEDLGMGTDIADALRSELDPFMVDHGALADKRRMVVAVLTDGAPPAPQLKELTEGQTRTVIEQASQRIHDPGALRISFFRIGSDPDGDDFFRSLPGKLRLEGVNSAMVRCSELGNDAGHGLMEALINSVVPSHQ
jgi:Mg-chelatase subunit ChlD